MKQISYILLAVSIIFTACKKEEEEPTNGNNSTISIIGIWTPTSVVIDSSLTTTINGEIVYELNGETISFSGSETITAEEADIDGDIEFTSDGYFITDDDTGSYTYSNNLLTLFDDSDDAVSYACSFTATDLSVTIEENMDTAYNVPGIGNISITSSFSQTIQCTRSNIINSNVNQKNNLSNSSWITKPRNQNFMIKINNFK